MPCKSNNRDRKIRINKILYFGNPFLAQDSLAIKVAERLKEKYPLIEFAYVQNTFELIDLDLSDCVLLDVVMGIDEVALLSSKNISSSTVSTTHDFDLGFFLKLTGKEAVIIGLPMDLDVGAAFESTIKIIDSFFDQ